MHLRKTVTQKALKKTGDQRAVSAQNFEAKGLNAGGNFAHLFINRRGKEESEQDARRAKHDTFKNVLAAKGSANKHPACEKLEQLLHKDGGNLDREKENFV
jgi:hypothetical protein